jgi:hypothetical protein
VTRERIRPPGTSFLVRTDQETADAIRAAAKAAKARYPDWIVSIIRERLELPEAPAKVPDESKVVSEISELWELDIDGF